MIVPVKSKQTIVFFIFSLFLIRLADLRIRRSCVRGRFRDKVGDKKGRPMGDVPGGFVKEDIWNFAE